ncbi:hypothetical protein [Streptomyces kanasensis]|uniref:hypothetical protein n=1 Tax=Streptomyces kanasensis TaxID=936756 RepID=UPI0037FB0256
MVFVISNNRVLVAAVDHADRSGPEEDAGFTDSGESSPGGAVRLRPAAPETGNLMPPHL